jgi:hypothetical protein
MLNSELISSAVSFFEEFFGVEVAFDQGFCRGDE